jgi:hypothetical protein
MLTHRLMIALAVLLLLVAPVFSQVDYSTPTLNELRPGMVCASEQQVRFGLNVILLNGERREPALAVIAVS